MCGYGEYTFSNKDNYKGSFKNDKLNGQGVLTYNNGDCYEGNFVNNFKDG